MNVSVAIYTGHSFGQELLRGTKWPAGVFLTKKYDVLLMDPDFRLPRTIRILASKANLLDAGSLGWPWWTYTARFRKPTGEHMDIDSLGADNPK